MMPSSNSSKSRRSLFLSNVSQRPKYTLSIPEHVCAQVREVLLCCPNGLEMGNFPNAYRKRFGYCLQTTKLGCFSLREFFINIQGVSLFNRNNIEYVEFSNDIIRKKSPPSCRSPPGFSRHDSAPTFSEITKQNILKQIQPTPSTTYRQFKPIITELNPLSESPYPPEDKETIDFTDKLPRNNPIQEIEVINSGNYQTSPPSTPGTSVSKFITPPPQICIRKPRNQAALYKHKHGQNMSSKLSKEVSDLLATLPPSVPLDELVEAYKSRYGFDFPFQEYGFDTSQDLIQSLWQTCHLDKRENGVFVTAVNSIENPTTQQFVHNEQPLSQPVISVDPEIASRVRKLLLKWPSGMPISLIQEKFHDTYREELPFLELGFDDVVDMMAAIPEYVELESKKNRLPNRMNYILYGIPLSTEECQDQMLPIPDRSNLPADVVISYTRQPIPATWDFLVYVPFVDNPDRFWIQLIRPLASVALEEVLLTMTKFYNELDCKIMSEFLLNNPGEGQNCAAPYLKDGYYYRAKILKIPCPDQAEVYYVDYGNRSKVPLGSLRRMRVSDMLLPAQAIECRLANVKPLDGVRWVSGSGYKLKMLVNDIELQCRVQNIESNDILSVHLSDPKSESSQSINNSLIECGIAYHEENNIPLHPMRTCATPEDTPHLLSHNPSSLPPHVHGFPYQIPPPQLPYFQPPLSVPFPNHMSVFPMHYQYPQTQRSIPNHMMLSYPYQPPIQDPQSFHTNFIPPPPIIPSPATQQVPLRPTSNLPRFVPRFSLPPTSNQVQFTPPPPALLVPPLQGEVTHCNDREDQIIQEWLEEKEIPTHTQQFKQPPHMNTFEKVQKFLSTSSDPDQLQQQKIADRLRIQQLTRERESLVGKGVNTSDKAAFNSYLSDLNKITCELDELEIRLSDIHSPTDITPLTLPSLPSISSPITEFVPALSPPIAPAVGRGRSVQLMEDNRSRMKFKYKGIGRGGKMSDLI